MKRHKSITVSAEALMIAKELKSMGLATSIGDAFSKAIREYIDTRAVKSN